MRSHPSLTGKGSRSTCSCHKQRVSPSQAAAAAAAPRHRSCTHVAAAQVQHQTLDHKQQQQQQPRIPALPLPGQALQQHTLWPSQRLQQAQQSRCSVIPSGKELTEQPQPLQGPKQCCMDAYSLRLLLELSCCLQPPPNQVGQAAAATPLMLAPWGQCCPCWV